MDYLAVLKHGHQVGQGKLKLLSTVADGIEIQAGHVMPALQEVVDFFDGELHVHFRQEEVALFPALATAVGREGVVAAMLGEHQSIWKAIDILEEQMAAMESSSEEEKKRAAQEIKMIARHIVGLLGAHIEKEETMLQPLAEKILSPDVLRGVAEQMDAVHA